ncbi:reverse transcriptase domain-containing protein [Tanacetum coccineum]
MVTTRRNSDDDDPNFEAMIAAAVANALPNLTAALRTQITNDIRNGAESSGGSGGGGDAVPQGIHVWIERFIKLKPLAFRSTATPAEAEDWITHMENFFKCFPSSEQQRYEREYGSICQLDRENSGEYMERFTRLASFLRQPPVTLSYCIESGNSNKRDRDVNESEQGTRANKNKGSLYQGHASGSASQKRSTETLPPLPLCTTCGKPHPGICYKATGGCFTCGSTQYKVKDCPQAKQKQNMPTDFARLPPPIGRVYATTPTHSIISTAFAKKLNMTPTPLIKRIIISTPMKNHMLIDHEYVNCPLRFDDRIRHANLLPIHMLDFDVILGMDWLASHRATIDCYARTVIFEIQSYDFVLEMITEIAWELVLSSVQHYIPSNRGQSRDHSDIGRYLRASALEWTAPFELLYGRKCRAPICWDEVGERLIEGPELIEVTNEKVVVAKEKLKEARSRQKSYADKHRRDLEFQVGDRVFLKVSPFRGVKRFGIKGKLSPQGVIFDIPVCFLDFAFARNKVLSYDESKSRRVSERAFMTLFGQDNETFTSTMFLYVDQLQNQLDKDEFQEDKSMAAFWVLNNQFQKFIDWQYFLDYDSEMTENLFSEFTGIKVKQFRETLLLHMGNVKKSLAKKHVIKDSMIKG